MNNEQRITTATNTQSKTEPWKTSSSLSLLSILRHGVSFLLWLPFAHTHIHTQIDNVAASQSQQGSQVKIGKAARYANVEWGMENAILLTLCCTFNMATPC